MNQYEPNNDLQKAYDGLFGVCLCGHFESCSFCDGSMKAPREAVEKAAKVIGYQLYYPFNKQPVRNTIDKGN